MKKNPIVQFPDPRLRKKAKVVLFFNDSLRRLVRCLDRAMRLQSHGIGIAAPQIGVLKQVAIADVSERVPGAGRIVMVNPEIIECREERISREGCMSLPDYTAAIKRYDWVRVRYQDEYGTVCIKDSRGIEAVCVQHEIDHLNGVLFMDRVVSLKRDMMPRPKKRR